MSTKQIQKKAVKRRKNTQLKDNQSEKRRAKSPSGLPAKIIVDNATTHRVQSFKTTDFSRKISYDLIDSVYDRTILKKIITKYKFSIVPNYFQIQVENLDGTRNEELESLLTPIS